MACYLRAVSPITTASDRSLPSARVEGLRKARVFVLGGRMKLNVLRLWSLVVMLSLAVLPVRAQETRGNISGTVKDSTGVIPGATVEIRSTDTGATQTLVTNSSGYFEAP